MLLALSAGIGLVLYLAGWLLLPVRASRRTGRRPVRRGGAQVAEGAVDRPGHGGLRADVRGVRLVEPFSIGPAVVIAVIWYFGFYKPRQPPQERTPSSRPSGRGSARIGPTQCRWPCRSASSLPWNRPPRSPKRPRRGGGGSRRTRGRRASRKAQRRTPAGSAAGELRRVVPPDRRPDASDGASGPDGSGAPMAQPRYADPALEPSFESERGAFLASPDPVGLYADSRPPRRRPGTSVADVQARPSASADLPGLVG